MPKEHGDARRREDGSIDCDYYQRRGVSLRTQAIRDIVGQLLRRVRARATPLPGSAAARRAG